MGCLPDTTFALVGRHKQGGKCFLEKHLQTKVHRAVPSINSVGSTSSAVLSEVQSQDLKKGGSRRRHRRRGRPGTRTRPDFDRAQGANAKRSCGTLPVHREFSRSEEHTSELQSPMY